MRMPLKVLVVMGFAAGLWVLSAGVAEASESCFTSKLNAARAANGRAALSTRSDLVAIARRHSARMASSGTIFHNSRLQSEAPSDWQSIGENVGMGPTCDEIHTAFMNSASHRRNILDPDYNYVGVGVVVAEDTTIYVTQVFMQAPAGGSAPAPSAPRTTTPRTTTPRTTTPAKPSAPKPAPPVAAPPPPAGSKIPLRTLAYLSLLETEQTPSDESVAEYKASKNPSASPRPSSSASSGGP